VCARGGGQWLRGCVCIPGISGRTFSSLHVRKSAHLLMFSAAAHLHKVEPLSTFDAPLESLTSCRAQRWSLQPLILAYIGDKWQLATAETLLVRVPCQALAGRSPDGWGSLVLVLPLNLRTGASTRLSLRLV